MADSIELRVEGLNGVIEKLKTLAPRLQRTGLRRASRKAMNIVRDAVRANAKAIDDPQTKEKVWKNIVTQESPRGGKREGGIMMRVGVRGGASRNQYSQDASGNPGGDTRHWRYIELGTEHMQAHPFLRPALQNNIAAVTEKLAAELRSEIDRLV
ncbi:HK97-gp10 family putative phage morphogenesis protein [Pseudomonas sp.]|uniref:HK97-gp10 family putative phage morphogenesis protein n=1 Tax=Pseudomonas sp. TaxID=306 RepID=UPI003FD7CB1D